MNHKLVGCDSIEVYKNLTKKFKLSRHASPKHAPLKQWRIRLGETHSFILYPYLTHENGKVRGCTKKDHSKNDFDALNENVQVTVADKSITISNGNGKIFLKCSDDTISKSILTHMSVIPQTTGYLQIEKIKGLFILENSRISIHLHFIFISV